MKAFVKWLMVLAFAVGVGVAWSSPWYLAAGRRAATNWAETQIRNRITDPRTFPRYVACVNEKTQWATVLLVARGEEDNQEYSIFVYWVFHFARAPERASYASLQAIARENIRRVNEVFKTMAGCMGNLSDWNVLHLIQGAMAPITTVDDGRRHVFFQARRDVIMNRAMVLTTSGIDDALEWFMDVSTQPQKHVGLILISLDVTNRQLYLAKHAGTLQRALEYENREIQARREGK